MKNLTIKFPKFSIRGITDSQLANSLVSFLNDLNIFQQQVIDVVNTNSFLYVAQGTMPDPGNGRACFWKNTAATAGQPTHFIVYNDNGTLRTFASVEVV